MIPLPSTLLIKLGIALALVVGLFGAGVAAGKHWAGVEVADLKRQHAEQLAAAHAARAAEVEQALERARTAAVTSERIANEARAEKKRLAAARADADAAAVRLRDARTAYLAAWAARPPGVTVPPGGDLAAPDPGGLPDHRRIAELSERLDRVGRDAAQGADACHAGFRAFERWVERALIPACGGATGKP